MEGHGDVGVASDTTPEDMVDDAGHTSVAAAGIDVDVDGAAADAAEAPEALAVQADVVLGTALTRARAASTDLGDSCIETAAETSVHIPSSGRPSWCATAAAH